MTRTVIAIRHVHFEDLGAFDDVLRRHGYAVRYCDACIDDIGGVDPLAPDLTVVLGGPIGAYQELTYPFLGQELALLERRLTAARPTLGICLGAQLMARALGARVYPAPEKELGWGAVQLTEAGHSAILPRRPFSIGTATLSTFRRAPSFSLRQRSAQTRRSASDATRSPASSIPKSRPAGLSAGSSVTPSSSPPYPVFRPRSCGRTLDASRRSPHRGALPVCPNGSPCCIMVQSEGDRPWICASPRKS